MKQFKCENQQLAGFLEVLDKTVVEKGKVKRGKAKLFKALLKKQHEFEDDALCIHADYFEVERDRVVFDDKGRPITLDGVGGKELAEHSELILELDKEEAVIDLVEHETKIKAFFNALECDEFESAEGFNDIAFDTLYDKLENLYKGE